MKVKIVPIGNSRGIRLPKSLIEMYQFTDEVDLDIKEDGLVIRPIYAPRQSWRKAFGRMAEQGDDKLLDIGRSSIAWDEDEWKW